MGGVYNYISAGGRRRFLLSFRRFLPPLPALPCFRLRRRLLRRFRSRRRRFFAALNCIFVEFCDCTYFLHLQPRTTSMRYVRILPFGHASLILRRRTTWSTHRYSSTLIREWILTTSEYHGREDDGRQTPEQMTSLIGFTDVQKPSEMMRLERSSLHS